MSNKYRLTISKESITLTLILIYIYTLSSIIGPQYIYGDQQHYREFYNAIYGTTLKEGFEIYKNALGSREPVYYFIAWLSSNLDLNKDNIITISNLFLAFFSFKYLSKLGAHPLISLILICFNYYFFVFYFAAERLKFGILFLAILGVIHRYKVMLVILATMSHIQSLMVLMPFIFPKIKDPIYNLIYRMQVRKSLFPVTIISICTLIIIVLPLQEHILSKFNYYRGALDLGELIKVMIFCLLSLFYSKSKVDVTLAFIPIFIFTILFGGDRVNFIAYFAFLYFSIHYRKGFNFGVLLTLAYFCYTGYLFIDKILEYGTGFTI